MSEKKRVGFYCKEDLHEDLKQLSEETGVPISKIIEKALNKYMGDEDTYEYKNSKDVRK